MLIRVIESNRPFSHLVVLSWCFSSIYTTAAEASFFWTPADVSSSSFAACWQTNPAKLQHPGEDLLSPQNVHHQNTTALPNISSSLRSPYCLINMTDCL